MNIFNLKGTIRSDMSYNTNYRCPKCKHLIASIHMDNRSARVSCIKCKWEENYIIIRRNDK